MMKEILESIDTAYNQNKEQIEADIFNLALEGIANNRMDYAKDPILPHIQSTLNRIADQISKISPEQQKKLVSLTAEQL